MKVLVTGASGFVGSALLRRLAADPALEVLAAYRNGPPAVAPPATPIVVGDMSPETDWEPALAGVDCVVHLAARVHVMHDTAGDPLAEFRRANVACTLRLARQAVECGVRRFIFVSSIKVNGEATAPGGAFGAADLPAPQDAYGISKHEAEKALFDFSAKSGLEPVVIRPPIVYGPGVRANFRSLMKWLARGVPLPLGAIDNRRSLVALDNLVDLIATCVRHPAAAGQIFLAADGEDLSTAELARRLGRALGRPARLLRVPPTLLQKTATFLGRGAVAQRLCGSLRVDSSKARQRLGWIPPLTVDEGLQRAANDYLGAQRCEANRLPTAQYPSR